MVTCMKQQEFIKTMRNKTLSMNISTKILLTLLILLGSAKTEAIKTKTINYSVEHGLSQSTVISIAQDDLGQMWFGTRNGLNLFNGYYFETFLNDPDDSTTIINNEITKVFKLDSINLLVGTRNGICKLNILTKQCFRYDYTQPGYSEFVVNDIYKDKQGRIWVAARKGIFKYDKESDNFLAYKKVNSNTGSVNSIAANDENGLWLGTSNGIFRLIDNEWQVVTDYLHNPDGVKSKRITSICFDRYSNLWVGTRNNGVAHISLKSDIRIKYLTVIPNEITNAKLASNEIRSIIEDKKGRIWIGTKEGVNIFDPFTNEVDLIQSSTSIINSISQNSVYSVFEDINKGIWIGTWSGGVNLLEIDYKGFVPISRFSIGDESGLFRAVSSITKINDTYWIGTENNGIVAMDNNWNTVKLINTKNTNNKLRSNHIKKLLKDQDNNLWIGFYDRGLQMYSPKTGKITDYIDHMNIYDIAEYPNKTFWISSRRELVRYNSETKQATIFSYTGEQESTNQQAGATFCTTEDKTIWTGSRFGLDIYNLQTNKFIRHYDLTDLPNGNYSMQIFSLAEDNKKNIWIGTSKGLYYCDTKEDTTLRVADSRLKKYIVYGIIPNGDDIWLSTDKGILSYNTASKNINSFTQMDGLQNNEFIRKSYYKTPDNTFIFGGINGFTAFDPQLINKADTKPLLLISQMEYTDNKGRPQTTYYPNKVSSQIVLSPNQPNITFKYAGIDYLHSNNLRYAFKLDGLLNKWISNESQQSISFTKLKPGSYTFRLRFLDENNQLKSQESVVHFKIQRPFHATFVAYIIYLILISLIIYSVAKFMVQKRTMQNELRLEKLEHDKLAQLNELKTKFFMNVSHEFRTPLTVIHGPIQRMIEKKNYSLEPLEAKTMLRNTERLINLLDQLLELRKVEKGKVKMKLQYLDLSIFAKDLLQLFRTIAYEKNITLEIEARSSVNLWFDSDKMQKIISNLISNAIKFTPENGRITIEVSENQNPSTEEINAEFSIIDNGIGMTEDQLKNIFNRFESTEASSNPKGIGIGLALAYELVLQHHGNITVDSEPGKGSAFTISIPKNKNVYTETDQVEFVEYIEQKDSAQKKEDVVELKKKSDKQNILVIDDNRDIRQYVAGMLSEHNIIEAESVEEAENYLTGNMPDLIISDVILPGKSGYEFCKQIKSDQFTSHIPVILMTAKGSDDNRVQGLELGADAFIPKPFNERIMKVWVDKLLLAQKKMFDYYMSHVIQDSSAANGSQPKIKDSFLEKARKIIEKDIANPELSVEMLSKQMNMSRSNLHLKFKSIINQTPSDFIRIIRLNFAAQILLNNDSNIVEAAYSSGFNSPSYFAKCFKQHFKKTPTEFVEQHIKADKNKDVDTDYAQKPN